MRLQFRLTLSQNKLQFYLHFNQFALYICSEIKNLSYEQPYQRTQPRLHRSLPVYNPPRTTLRKVAKPRRRGGRSTVAHSPVPLCGLRPRLRDSPYDRALRLRRHSLVEPAARPLARTILASTRSHRRPPQTEFRQSTQLRACLPPSVEILYPPGPCHSPPPSIYRIPHSNPHLIPHS